MGFGLLTTGSAGQGIFISGSPEFSGLSTWSVVGWFKKNIDYNFSGAGLKLIANESASVQGGWSIAINSTTGSLRVSHKRITTNAQYTTTYPIFSNTDWIYLAVTFEISSTNSFNLYTGTISSSVASRSFDSNQQGAGTWVPSSANDIFSVFAGGINAAGLPNSPGPYSSTWVQFYTRKLTFSEIQSLQFTPRLLDNSCKLFLFDNYLTNYSGHQYIISSSTVSYVSGAPIPHPYD